MPHNLWWPDDFREETEEVVRGSGVHHRPNGPSRTHLFTMKQEPEGKLIWACACGETISRLVHE